MSVSGLKKINQKLNTVCSFMGLQVKPVWCYYFSITSGDIWIGNVLLYWFWVHVLLLGWYIWQQDGNSSLVRLSIPRWLLVLYYSLVCSGRQFCIHTNHALVLGRLADVACCSNTFCHLQPAPHRIMMYGDA